MSTFTHCEAINLNAPSPFPTSALDWREVVHDALHSQPALEAWHNYATDLEQRPALILYDQINRDKDCGMIFLFEPSMMSVYLWVENDPVFPVGFLEYMPEAPSKFLGCVFRNVVNKVHCVDRKELRTYLNSVDRLYAATKTKKLSAPKRARGKSN